MYSQCPECQARFRVTAEVLRTAHGTVRCGRCGSAFDALARLTDSLSEPAPIAGFVDPASMLPPDLTPEVTGTYLQANGDGHGMAGRSRTDSTAEQPEPEFHFSADDIERVFVDPRDWQERYGAERHHVPGFDAPANDADMDDDRDRVSTNDAAAGDGNIVLDETGTFEDFEDITLEGERIHIEGLPDFLLEQDEEQLIDVELLEEQSGAVSPEIIDAASLEPLGTLDPTATDLVNAELLEAQIQQALAEAEALVGNVTAGSRARADLDPTDRFEILRVDDLAATDAQDDLAADVEVRTIKPREALLPGLVPVAAANANANAPAPKAPTLGELRPARARWRGEAASSDDASATSFATLTDDRTFDADDASTSSRRWLWGLGALALFIVLALQLTHYFRRDLVRDPNLGPVLRTAYARLGLPLDPDWMLQAYELRQWGASDTAPVAGAMTVRVGIKNRADFPQPLPLLRLQLEDRFGGNVASRDFEPREYLTNPAQASRMLDADASVEAELALADTPADAVGYKLDVCLRDAAHGITCAQAVTP